MLQRLICHMVFWTLFVAPGAHAQERLAVLEFQGRLDSDVLQKLTDEARGGSQRILRESGSDMLVMSRENMMSFLSDAGISGECIEGECEVETGRNLGAAYVVSGKAISIEGTYLVTMRVHDTTSGALLGQEEARGTTMLGTVDSTSSVVEQLLAASLGLSVAHSTPAAAAGPSSGAFTSSVGLDLDRKLREKNCDDEAESEGLSRREAAMRIEVARIVRSASEAWSSLSVETQRCLQLDWPERDVCAQAVEDWLAQARAAEVTLPAGVEWVESACGPREQVYTESTRAVTIAEVPQAEDRLAELRRPASDIAGSGSEILREADALYYGDAGTMRNEVAAAKLYAQSCEEGSVRGCLEYAHKRWTGRGVPKNTIVDGSLVAPSRLKEAASACVQGDARMCLRLGTVYQEGMGLPRELSTAATMYGAACSKGEMLGCSNLAQMYEFGLGMNKDTTRARALYRQACAGGHVEACKRR